MDNYEGIMYVGDSDTTDESTLEVLIKFCSCGGGLKEDNRIHDVSEMFQFIITHMVLIEEAEGEITLEVMQASLMLSQQESYITIIGPPHDGKKERSVHYAMMVSCPDMIGMWPRIDLIDNIKYTESNNKNIMMELINGIPH